MKRLLFLVVSSCVDEYDPEVIVVLPDVQDPCGTIGAARARVMIETTDGEHFEVTSSTCTQFSGVSGFKLALDRLTYGYHRAAIAIDDAAGTELGRIERPFAAATPLVALFEYADLPGWPVAPLVLAPITCPAPTLTVTVRPSLATRPVLVTELVCSAITIAVPRGPTHIEARASGDPCAIAEAFVDTLPDDPLALIFQPTECP